ncbi:TetR/AcrR family transcriptional regulator [Vibrio coralliilyticus]|uniref:TetR/AcrR family transcriptional regulator n=1 Tax=Vibrio coralliilyticus TaxID=190893 RepID=UPI0005127E5B|nr:TetR/AcrR family transcriptional regulator [Vibrio coralliilyticus]AIS57888.1 TetR family transcriptional regulator [Vibrio coralliilyticus]
MGNAVKFDRQQVIDKATHLYWEKGFHATSMRHLQEVIDMRPGSIYAAFGSKEELFKQALSHYTQMGISKLEQFKSQNDSPLAALKAFVKHLVLQSKKGAPDGMCMLAKSVAELTEANQDLLDEARHSLRLMERQFELVLQQAQQQGELSADKDTHRLASHVQIQIAGLRTYAKANNNPELLESLIDDMFGHYPF